jgi:hypothetical protein
MHLLVILVVGAVTSSKWNGSKYREVSKAPMLNGQWDEGYGPQIGICEDRDGNKLAT